MDGGFVCWENHRPKWVVIIVATVDCRRVIDSINIAMAAMENGPCTDDLPSGNLT